MVETHYYNRMKSLNAITLVRKLTTKYYSFVGYKDVFEAIDDRLVKEMLNQITSMDEGATRIDRYTIYRLFWEILYSEASILSQSIAYEPKEWDGFREDEQTRQEYLLSVLCGLKGEDASRNKFINQCSSTLRNEKYMNIDGWDYDGRVEVSLKMMSKLHIETLRIKSLKVSGTSYDVGFKLPPLTLGRAIETTIGVPIKTQGSGDSFTLRAESATYYNGLQQFRGNWRWRREGRQVMKLSKFIRNFRDCVVVVDSERLGEDLTNKIKDRYMEILITAFKPKELEIKISDEVSRIYRTATALQGVGTLSGSCMNKESYNGTSEYVTMYDGISKIAYSLDSDNKLQSRALIWDIVIENRLGEEVEATLMDRIYGTEETQDAFKRLAEKNGWWHKVDQSHSSTDITNTSDGAISGKYRTRKPIVLDDSMEAPYVDTLKYYTRNGYLMSVSYWDDYEVVDELTRLEAGGECANCGCSVDEDDIVYTELSGESGCLECTVWCEFEEVSEFRDDVSTVVINGDSIAVTENFCASNYDLVWVEDEDEYLPIDDCAWIESTDEYVRVENARYCDHNDTFIREDDSVALYDGEYAHIDYDAIIELDNGEYALETDCAYNKEEDKWTLNC